MRRSSSSGLAYKEHRNHHPILTISKKLKKLKNLLRSVKKVRSQSKLLSPKLERDKQVRTENHNVPGQKPTSRNLWRREPVPEQETWTVRDKLLELSVDNSELKTPGDPVLEAPTLLWVLPLETLSVSHSEDQWKVLSCFQQGVEKRNPFEILQTIIFLTRLALRRNYLTRA